MSAVDAPRDDGPGDGAPITDPATVYVVYTDGSCKPNPGPGGWAYVLMYGDETWEESGEEGIEEDTVSLRMEVMAVVHALAYAAMERAVVQRRAHPRRASPVASLVKSGRRGSTGSRAHGGRLTGDPPAQRRATARHSPCPRSSGQRPPSLPLVEHLHSYFAPQSLLPGQRRK